MKTATKIKLVLSITALLLAANLAKAQEIDQSANWPNANWLVTGTYNTDPTAFEADPRATFNFAFDDQDAGNGNNDNIAAESPVIDLTSAYDLGETWLKVTGDYTYHATSNDILQIEYWDADDSNWIVFKSFLVDSPNGSLITNIYCDSFKDPYSSNIIDIAAFTHTQLSGFKYRIYFRDNNFNEGSEFGFCFDSPTLTSSLPIPPPTCVDPEELNAVNITVSTADLLWEDDTNTNWDIEWDISGFTPSGIPTINDTANNPYTLTGLAEITAYDFYVRADCNMDNISDLSQWVGPFSFTTQDPSQLNDDCPEAVLLTVGAVFEDYPLDASLTGATLDAVPNLCGNDGPGIWYLVVVPSDGNITIETGPDSVTGNSNFDTVIEAFSGLCNDLNTLGCDDDDGILNYSLLDLTGLDPGSTIHIRVWEYGGDNDEPFAISAYNGSVLGVADFEPGTLTVFPNPAENVLYINAEQPIEKVLIYNMSGQLVLGSLPNNTSGTIDISELALGVYFVKVIGNSNAHTFKIIKK